MVRRGAVSGSLVLVFVAVAALAFGGGGGNRYELIFQTAGQLVPGNQVMIGGHPVGSVEDVDLTDDSQARITIEIDQELHRGSTAVIRATSLAGVANHYVSISPGPNSEPELADDATLGPESTTTPVDVDQVFAAFTPRTREGLRRFIRGQAAVYAAKGEQANRSYKYLEPALSRTDRVLDEINADQRLFRRFITSSARVFTALADRRDDLEQSISSANTAFGAIARENLALDSSLRRLAPTFRQSNTAFVNLRAALDDLQPLVDTAKPATRDLAPLLARLRPVVSRAIPVFGDLRATVRRPGAANDLGDLFATLPEVEPRASVAFGRAERAIADFQPTLDFARPYTPDILNALTKLGQVTGYYDANGHYARAGVADLNLFGYDPADGSLDAAPAAEQFAPYGDTRISRRCPGGASAPAADGSSPFVGPQWTESGLTADDCDPAQVPAGP